MSSKRFRWLLLGLTFCMGVAISAPKATPSSRLSKSSRLAVTVIETVLSGTSIPVITMYSGPVGTTGGGLTLLPTQTNAFASSIVSVPALPYVDGEASKAQILDSAKSNIMSRANDVGAKLKALMDTNGYKAANFIFEQTITPQGSATPVKVSWQVSVLDSGRVLYGSPRLTDPDPFYLHVIYTSKRVASGLPAAWEFPDGGRLKYHLVKKDGTELTPLTFVDVLGAFDEPLVASGTSFDPDFGVKCLSDITSSASCVVPPTSSGFVDVKTLLSSTNAASAIIDYTRKLEPSWLNNADGTQQANIAISFDSRRLHHNDSCTNGTYTNAGRYGYTLQQTYDRYLLGIAESTPQPVGRSTTNSFSPTENFELSQNSSSTVTGLSNLVINPFDATGPLVNASTVAGVQYIAPVTEEGSSGITKKYVHGAVRGGSPGNPVYVDDYECFDSNSWIYAVGRWLQFCGPTRTYTVREGSVVSIDRTNNIGIQMEKTVGNDYYYSATLPVIERAVDCPLE